VEISSVQFYVALTFRLEVLTDKTEATLNPFAQRATLTAAEKMSSIAETRVAKGDHGVKI